MSDRSTKNKKVNILHDNVITKTYRAMAVYFFVGASSMGFFNMIALRLFGDEALTRVVMSLIGVLFIFATAMFMWWLIERYNRILYELREAYINSTVVIEKLSSDNQQNELYNLLSSYLTDNYSDDKIAAIEMFRYMLKRIKVCDIGSIISIEGDKVTFLDAKGFDLDALNNSGLKAENIEFYTVGVFLRKDIEPKLERSMGRERYQKYTEHNPRISESLYVGLIDSPELKVMVSLDISESNYLNNEVVFTDELVREVRNIQLLATAMFEMRTLISYRNIIQQDIANSFVTAFEFHDSYTTGHSIEVARISRIIGECLELPEEELNELYWSALLHDIGKIIIPKEILQKEGPLTDEEYKVIKEHPTTGDMFLEQSESLKQIGKFIKYHHERYDGKGYPKGLSGEDIPMNSRIINIADAYHAMISDRPFRKGYNKAYVLQEIINNESKQFCPVVTEAFLQMYDHITKEIVKSER